MDGIDTFFLFFLFFHRAIHQPIDTSINYAPPVPAQRGAACLEAHGCAPLPPRPATLTSTLVCTSACTPSPCFFFFRSGRVNRQENERSSIISLPFPPTHRTRTIEAPVPIRGDPLTYTLNFALRTFPALAPPPPMYNRSRLVISRFRRRGQI